MEGERDRGRDGGGGVRGTRLLRGWEDTGGGREERGGSAPPFFPSTRVCDRSLSLVSLVMLKSGSLSLSELQSLRSVISRSESDSGSCFTPPRRSNGLCRPPATPPRPIPPRPSPNPNPSPNPGSVPGVLDSLLSLSPTEPPLTMSVRPSDRAPG